MGLREPAQQPDRPKVKKKLANGEYVVITRNGRIFVFNKETGKSRWDIPDDPELILLVAKARGFKESEATDIQTESASGSASFESESNIEADIQSELQDVVDSGPIQTIEIISDDESDLDLSDFETAENPDSFKQMLDEKRLNPFKSWEFHRDSLVDEPGYMELESNSRRQQVYDEWALTRKTSVETPTDQFLDLVHRESNPNRFYIQFKRLFRALPEFDVPMPDKVKEQLYREYYLALKKTPEQREEILKTTPTTEPKYAANYFVNEKARDVSTSSKGP